MPVPLRANANLRAEAKYNVVTDFPNFDLHSAAASGNLGLVEYALGRGQPVNSVLDGVLPLHAACAGGHEQVVKILIDHGADVNAPRLPRRYSNDKNRDASAPIVGTTGSTPLHFAVANGHKNVITVLLLRGAHADRRDKYGVTPAALAEQHGWLECVEVLENWVKDKDRDLRERDPPVNTDEFGAGIPVHERYGSLGLDEDTSGSTRKRLQVKRSIDTALNIFKSSSCTPPSKLAISSSSTNLPALSPPTSPTRSRGDFSPSPSEDARSSPSPSPIDPGARRPSLPHILYPPPSGASPRYQKASTPTKPPRNPRRPRSAGTDAEQQSNQPLEGEGNHPVFGRGGAGRKLGTKYSLMNLFKKGQGNDSSSGVPLERTTSHQASSSAFILSSSQTSSSVNISNLSSFSSSPKQSSFVTLPSSDNSPLPRPGFRFGNSDTAMRSRTAPTATPQTSRSLSHTRASPSSIQQQQPYSPPRTIVPLAVDLHNALAAQQNRNRSGSSSSTAHHDSPNSVAGLEITFDEAECGSTSGSVSTSPLNNVAIRRIRPQDVSHRRERSGSNSSNRNAAVYDDEVILGPGLNSSSGDLSLNGSNGVSRTSSRPGILRGHNRTSSTGQSVGSVLRARFDPKSNSSGVISRKETDVQPSSPSPLPLRGCTSAGSLKLLDSERRSRGDYSPSRISREFKGVMTSSPKTIVMERLPDSAPAAITDFDTTSRNTEEDDNGDPYGQPLEHFKLAPGAQSSQSPSRLDILTRNRGLSFASSESSLSPDLSAAEVDTATASILGAEFPFSINRPPPVPLDESEGTGPGSQVQLQVSPPPSTSPDSRMRGDSISSISTTDSTQNPSLSTSATTSGSGGSGTVNTPLRSPEGGSYLNLPIIDLSRSRSIEKFELVAEPQSVGYADGLNSQARTSGVVVVGLNERREHTPLENIDLTLVASHAEAEALVQRTKQDILSAYADGLTSSDSVGYTPLSARLAALGESLELERKLREQRQAEELRAKGEELPLPSSDTEFIAPTDARASLYRQASLDHKSPKSKQKEPRRPHTSSGTSVTDGVQDPLPSSVERRRPTHHSSLSASAVETSSPVFDTDDVETPVVQAKVFDRFSPRSRTPDPDSNLSRISSLEGLDTDTELGPSLCRVLTAPNSMSSAREKRERTFASNTKLTRMGFTPTDLAGRTPQPKRFGGLKSLMQSLKGRP